MRHVAFGQTKRSVLDRIIAFVRVGKVRKVLVTGGRILDLGCGYNGDLLTALGPSFEGAGIDLSVNPKNKNLIKGRVDEPLPFKDASFETVTALAIIEHVDDPERMLAEIYRVLKPSGKILITTPALVGKLSLEIMSGLGLISREEIDDHKRYYTKTTLAEAMEKAKLKKVRVKHFGLAWMNLLAEGVR